MTALTGKRGNTILLQKCVVGEEARLLYAVVAEELDHRLIPGLGVGAALRHSLVTEGLPRLVTNLHT